ncbi:hypothetical protein [Sphingomonas sp. CFBP 13733]|uniref:hypothetical protein n=1 Tax=Sphingomonas sp. CFBP 13733 TaxID=2775291 RepID=UPI00177ACA69|nr:hypothetical protein [Sphingomonas sp. CFBP 13733]MBD8637987.1 hypothetical protein [Sphingomonas sp. CFBP 13733]
MSDKVHTPVPGNPASKGAPDGVSESPRSDTAGRVHGRSDGGESAGGAYLNPHEGKTDADTSPASQGGQTDIAYHGGGQAGGAG